MEENKVDIKECTDCPRRFARITGEFKCGLGQSRMNKGRMCLVNGGAQVGMYWVHEYDLRREKHG